jgi:hypothetical protein
MAGVVRRGKGWGTHTWGWWCITSEGVVLGGGGGRVVRLQIFWSWMTVELCCSVVGGGWCVEVVVVLR